MSWQDLENMFLLIQHSAHLIYLPCSMIGSDSSTTNYPGKIPHGLDLPSDVANDKHPKEKGVPN